MDRLTDERKNEACEVNKCDENGPLQTSEPVKPSSTKEKNNMLKIHQWNNMLKLHQANLGP